MCGYFAALQRQIAGMHGEITWNETINYVDNNLKYYLAMKKFILLSISLLLNISIFAQTQYDYYDDGAVAGGADRALHGIIIIGGIVAVVVLILLILGGAAKIYYWFNPEADPEYKRQMAIKKETEMCFPDLGWLGFTD